jgi:hypothetical protein
MTSRLRQRARIVRVRTIQHGLAAAVAEQAQRRVADLEESAARLADLRDGFGAGAGTLVGSSLASRGEIAMRLDLAREGLVRSIGTARVRAEICKDARIAAHRDQESAERLTERAVRDAARRAEKKQPQGRAPRARLQDQD